MSIITNKMNQLVGFIQVRGWLMTLYMFIIWVVFFTQISEKLY